MNLKFTHNTGTLRVLFNKHPNEVLIIDDGKAIAWPVNDKTVCIMEASPEENLDHMSDQEVNDLIITTLQSLGN